MKYNKGFAPIFLVAIIVGALVIGGGAYYMGKSKGEDKKVEENINTSNNKEVDDISQQDRNNDSVKNPIVGVEENKQKNLTLIESKTFGYSIGYTGIDKSKVYITGDGKSINLFPNQSNIDSLEIVDLPYNKPSYISSTSNVTFGINQYQKFKDNITPRHTYYLKTGLKNNKAILISVKNDSDNPNYLNLPSLKIEESTKSEKQIGYIKSIYSKDNTNYLTIDYVQWTHCDTDDCVQSIKVINDNPLIRTFPISNNVIVKTVTYPDSSGNYSLDQNLSLNKFKEALDYSLNHVYNPDSYQIYYPNKKLYWITIENGIVTEIAEQFQA